MPGVCEELHTIQCSQKIAMKKKVADKKRAVVEASLQMALNPSLSSMGGFWEEECVCSVSA